MFADEQILTHELAAHYVALRKIKTSRALFRSDLWKQIGGEVDRILSGVEIAHRASSERRNHSGLRVAAWNLQRGRNFDDIQSVLAEINADLVLLVEVDNGMGRSGDRHVARELAGSLEMSYAFSPSYLVLQDDFGENPDKRPNSLALAGTAILSRLPICRATNLDLPSLRDKFSSTEKRIGHKRALLVEVVLGDGVLPVAACHLDSIASPSGRARQMAALLGALPDGRALVGGDFNSSTYNLESPLALFKDLWHKMFVTGFAATISQYMTPEMLYEKPMFDELFRRGFAIESFNDRAFGTLRYNLNDTYAIEKARRQVGSLLTWWLRRRLRPWNGVVPARLDWFAGRGVQPRQAFVADGRKASDHSPIVVELV